MNNFLKNLTFSLWTRIPIYQLAFSKTRWKENLAKVDELIEDDRLINLQPLKQQIAPRFMFIIDNFYFSNLNYLQIHL